MTATNPPRDGGLGRDLQPGHLFCFGLGFSARYLADRLLARGWRVSGTCRSPEKQQALAALGITAHLFDRDRPVSDLVGLLAGVTDVLSSVPPDSAGDPVIDLHKNDLAQAASHLSWIGYLSTTGVYGDRNGDWVDETTPIAPNQARSKRRAEAEAAWLKLCRDHAVPVHVFRLAGIYGPGRNQLEGVKRGTAHRIIKPGKVFCRIHVEDIASVLEASMARPGGLQWRR